MAHSSSPEVGKDLIHFFRPAVTFGVIAPNLEPDDNSINALTSLSKATLALCKHRSSNNGKVNEVRKLYSESTDG